MAYDPLSSISKIQRLTGNENIVLTQGDTPTGNGRYSLELLKKELGNKSLLGTVTPLTQEIEQGVYIASETGVYPNFGNIEVTQEEIESGLVMLSKNHDGTYSKDLLGMPGVVLINDINKDGGVTGFNPIGFIEEDDYRAVSGDVVNIALSYTTEQTANPYKEDPNKFIRVDGSIANATGFRIRYYKYTHQKNIKVSTVINAQGINLVSYFSGSDFLSSEYLINNLNNTEFIDAPLSVPANCTDIAINSSNVQGVVFKYTEVGDRVNFNELRDSVNNDKKYKVVIGSKFFYIRTTFDETQDIIMRYEFNVYNLNITPRDSFLGSKNSSDSDILNSGLIHYYWDSTGPVWMPEYWYLFAQHGYLIPTCTLSGHGKTSADIGSIYKDNNDREYSIGKIEGTKIFLLPKINIGATEGLDTRDWKVHSDNNYTTLTHVSGGVNTASITPTSKGTEQLRPIEKPFNRIFLADNKEVEEGTFYCDTFTASESLECFNPTKVTKWFPDIVSGSNMAIISHVYSFEDLGCSVSTFLNTKYPLLFTDYGANQAITFTDIKGYKSFAFLPKMKQVADFYDTDLAYPFSTSDTARKTLFADRGQYYLLNSNDMPDRIISILKNGNTPVIGFASGNSLTRGISKKSVWNENIKSLQQCLQFSPSNNNKFYTKLLRGENFENSLLPKDEVYEVNFYFSYFKPKEKQQVYNYNDGGKNLIYIHIQDIQNNIYIDVDSKFNNKSFNIIESSGVVLKTDTIINNQLIVNTTQKSSYIVLEIL